jgi:7-cyano-7-deazaguanine synthase in queuosine biosynthesis
MSHSAPSSGGDSSAIVALMQANSTQRVQTFTIIREKAYNEADAARAVAQHLGTEHTELTWIPRGRWSSRSCPSYTTNLSPTRRRFHHAVCELAASVVVALSKR